uniref:Leucine-rich repeat-containing N-terminal plant-type domain-containing protein n=1 Tax=Fagus sylvatica TaxID=28930 RepID=A0A2N9F5J3_FAGSY
MQPLCHDDDSSALLQFKESFVMSKNACIHPFAYPKMASWKLEGDNRDCCSWDGVECDNGHWSCHIPPSLGFDYHLVSFPWSQLQVLDLRSNKLQALPLNPPPSTLVYSVADNMLQGEISPLICNLSSLYSLDLSNNNFRGILPHCLSNLSRSLNILNLRGNNFHGMIPQLCVKGSRMKMIDLSQNQFEGVLPRSLTNCRMVEILNLGSNKLNDVFPSWLGALPKLKVLILRHNGFFGAVGSPTTIFAFPKLRIVDLSSNKFTGLCGNPLSKKCENPEHAPLPTSSFEEDQDSWFHIEFDWKIILMGYGSGLVIGVVVGNIVAEKIHNLFVRTWKRQHKRGRSRITLFTIY